MLVKICGLTDEGDVAAAVEAGADALGFVFAESVRAVTPGHAARISRDIPEGLRRVAVMLHPSADEWRAVLREFKPDVLQTDAEDLATLVVPETVERWPVFRERGEPPVAGLDSPFVYEGPKSGTGATVDWRLAGRHALAGRMILAGGLSPANVASAISAVRPWGVDASSSLERAPGRKDAAKMAAFVSAARAADSETKA